MEFCHSCAAPLSIPDFRGPSEVYCKHCTDEDGNLNTREEVQQGIAGWFMSWQPGIDEATAATRAAAYMQAMPAWAE